MVARTTNLSDELSMRALVHVLVSVLSAVTLRQSSHRTLLQGQCCKSNRPALVA
jgi:hypothetical protein